MTLFKSVIFINWSEFILRIKKRLAIANLNLVGVVGFEPTEWRSQSPLPYHLATPQYI